MPIASMLSEQRISVLVDNSFKTFPLGSEQANRLIEALRQDPQDEILIAEIACVATWIAKHSFGRVTIGSDERLRLDGKLVDYGLHGILQSLFYSGHPISSLTNFIERVDRNPDKAIANDLYAFLSKGDLPLAPDGRFFAWKNVGEGPEFKSIHSGAELATITYADGSTVQIKGKLPHPLGGKVQLNREDCNPNRDQTCSRGLHACSMSYLPHYNSGRATLLVLIDPEHVTAIPTDYNQAKLRCCEYDVLAQVPREEVAEYLKKGVEDRFTPPVVEEPAAEATPETEIVTEIEGVIEEVKDAAYWAFAGCKAGTEHGENDREDSVGYSPMPSIPPEIENDAEFRRLYAEAYTPCYDDAFNGSMSVERARSLGEADGIELGVRQEDYNSDHTEGPAFGKIEDPRCPDYHLAFVKAYALSYKLSPFFAQKAAELGTQDGIHEAHTHFDDANGFDPNGDAGDNYANVPIEHDNAYLQAFDLAYIETWEALVAAQPAPVAMTPQERLAAVDAKA